MWGRTVAKAKSVSRHQAVFHPSNCVAGSPVCSGMLPVPHLYSTANDGVNEMELGQGLKKKVQGWSPACIVITAFKQLSHWRAGIRPLLCVSSDAPLVVALLVNQGKVKGLQITRALRSGKPDHPKAVLHLLWMTELWVERGSDQISLEICKHPACPHLCV